MNEILEYLKRCEDVAYNERFQHSANFLMSIPLEDHEKEHAQAIRDCAIVKKLISIIKGEPLTEMPLEDAAKLLSSAWNTYSRADTIKS